MDWWAFVPENGVGLASTHVHSSSPARRAPSGSSSSTHATSPPACSAEVVSPPPFSFSSPWQPTSASTEIARRSSINAIRIVAISLLGSPNESPSVKQYGCQDKRAGHRSIAQQQEDIGNFGAAQGVSCPIHRAAEKAHSRKPTVASLATNIPFYSAQSSVTP